jgi:hypothetical protein
VAYRILEAAAAVNGDHVIRRLARASTLALRPCYFILYAYENIADKLISHGTHTYQLPCIGR